VEPSKLIGGRIRAARTEHNLTQAALGQLLEPWLGKAWLKQAVSQAEQGRRDFTAAELLALAAVLQVPMGYFFATPPGDEQKQLEFPGGATVPFGSVLAIVYGLEGTTAPTEQAQMMVLRLAGDVQATLEKLGEQLLRAERGAALLVQLAQGQPAVEEAKEATSSKRRPSRKGGSRAKEG
jgi:transcriptional regulator with XRE-family HTH domain